MLGIKEVKVLSSISAQNIPKILKKHASESPSKYRDFYIYTVPLKSGIPKKDVPQSEYTDYYMYRNPEDTQSVHHITGIITCIEIPRTHVPESPSVSSRPRQSSVRHSLPLSAATQC